MRVKPVKVTRFGGVSFLRVKAAEWGSPPNRGDQNHWAKARQTTRQSNMTANR